MCQAVITTPARSPAATIAIAGTDPHADFDKHTDFDEHAVRDQHTDQHAGWPVTNQYPHRHADAVARLSPHRL